MTHETKCKFCGKTLTLLIDDGYPVAGDPLGILRLAACTRCGNYRSSRRTVAFLIKQIAENLSVSQDADLTKVRESLTALCKRYLRIMAEYRDQPVPEWDNAIVESIMAAPLMYGDVIGKMTSMCRQESLL